MNFRNFMFAAGVTGMATLFMVACSKEEAFINQNMVNGTSANASNEFYTVQFSEGTKLKPKIVRGKEDLDALVWKHVDLACTTVKACNDNTARLASTFNLLEEITTIDIQKGYYLRTKIDNNIITNVVSTTDVKIVEHNYILWPLKEDLIKLCKTGLYAIYWGRNENFEFRIAFEAAEVAYYLNEAFNSNLGTVEITYQPATTSQYHFDKGEYTLESL
jgi:hypothetical protein